MKITEKVSFNITSEASYVYILSWQKLIRNAKNAQFENVKKKIGIFVHVFLDTLKRGPLPSNQLEKMNGILLIYQALSKLNLLKNWKVHKWRCLRPLSYCKKWIHSGKFNVIFRRCLYLRSGTNCSTFYLQFPSVIWYFCLSSSFERI